MSRAEKLRNCVYICQSFAYNYTSGFPDTVYMVLDRL